jgi:hypothetical protein
MALSLQLSIASSNLFLICANRETKNLSPKELSSGNSAEERSLIYES